MGGPRPDRRGGRSGWVIPVGDVEVDGLIVVDKPAGMTSHDVVARIRRLARTRRVGHGGTLDPMATGVLIIGVNRATRLLTYVIGAGKSYTATIRLGQTTVTDDAEGDVTATVSAAGVTDEAIRAGLAAQTGEIQQVPSAVSAIKVNGQRAYKRVRDGEEVELAARTVTVSRLDVLAVRRSAEDGFVDVDVEVECSSGTYIRAIARDLGRALGVGGHLTALRRTRVGGFAITDAHPLADLEARQGEPMPVTPIADAARAAFTVREVDEAQARTLGYGQRLESEVPGRTEPVAAIAPDGTLVAMLDESRPTARSLVVFAPVSS